MNEATAIAGYTYGTREATSPVTLAEFADMQKSVLFGPDDVDALRRSLAVLEDQVEPILDVWYGFVGANPHLLRSFTSRKDGEPLGDYLGAVRRRFGRWILDTARAQYDQAWLDYQHEIGLRHHRVKNSSDEVEKMYNAWVKSCLLQVTLWSHPYVREGDF